MELVGFIRWLLLGLGIVYFLTESSIFALFRVWMTKGSEFRIGLFYCSACMGFWVGVAISGAWIHQGTAHGLESGIALMAVGAMWGSWRGNAAYEMEAPLRGEGVLHHDEAEESEDGR